MLGRVARTEHERQVGLMVGRDFVRRMRRSQRGVWSQFLEVKRHTRVARITDPHRHRYIIRPIQLDG